MKEILSNKKQSIPVISFLVIQFVLYCLILFGEINHENILCFLTVFLSFAVSFVFFSVSKKTYITHLALLFTVIADIFLVLCDPKIQSLAMISFSVVQMLYLYRIVSEQEKSKLNVIHIAVRAVLTIVVLAITAIVLKEKTDFVSLVSMFYFTNLVLNVVFVLFNKNSSWLLKVGLVCFMFCDIFVGLGQLGDYLPISETSFVYQLIHAPFNFIWFFYTPAQTMLCLSTAKQNFQQK